MKREDMVRMIRDSIEDVEAIYLFGSISAGTEHADSDIDLAVMTKAGLSPTRFWEVAQELSSMVSRDVDLINLREASTVMRMEIVSSGERIYCANEANSDAFENFVFADYARLNEERARILKDIRRRGSIYG